jgi:hypothetical protein
MTHTLTLVPCHKDKLFFGLNFFRTWSAFSENDFAFVFSSSEEENWMREKVGGDFISLILPKNMTGRGNQVTTKKLWGLEKMFEKGYSHIGVFDCDSAVVKKFDTNALYPDMYDSRIIKCNRSIPGGHIVRRCSEILGVQDDEKLRSETDDFKQYWWFNDICLYESNDFTMFSSWLSKREKYELVFDDWVCFDYILYGIYVIMERGFKVKRHMEGKEYDYGAIEHNRYDFNCESSFFKSSADRNSYHQLHEHIKVQIHLDR